jgi:hypothetical protein
MEWTVSAVMIFSMGCLFGAAHPDIPFIVWIALIFVGACAKVCLHHRRKRLQRTAEQKESAKSEDEAHGS